MGVLKEQIDQLVVGGRFAAGTDLQGLGHHSCDFPAFQQHETEITCLRIADFDIARQAGL